MYVALAGQRCMDAMQLSVATVFNMVMTMHIPNAKKKSLFIPSCEETCHLPSSRACTFPIPEPRGENMQDTLRCTPLSLDCRLERMGEAVAQSNQWRPTEGIYCSGST
mmetsp:Transcript_7120/g.13283  ORF Transcript_7120/g.13283 Transcript_7120/m.13283 type:complete len:108 (+) Transcript_7120:105-428(+)